MPSRREREFFLDNLLVRIHLIIVMTRWTGPVPWEFELSFPGSLASTFLGEGNNLNRFKQALPGNASRLFVPSLFRVRLAQGVYRGTSLIRTPPPLGPLQVPGHRATVGSWGGAFAYQ